MEENSFSIINRTNGQVTGQTANALPIKLVTGISWIRFVLIGFVIALIVFLAFIFTIKKQVSIVEVTGKADTYQILEIN